MDKIINRLRFHAMFTSYLPDRAVFAEAADALEKAINNQQLPSNDVLRSLV